jgi:Na+-transporting NADH:ubiquinone oxidoreductase subunit C
MPRETVGKTIAVAAGVCVVCSVFVSTASVVLKPIQDKNRTLERRRNILIAAGLMEPGQQADVDALFREIETRVVNLETDEFADEVAPEDVNPPKDAEDPELRIDVEDPRLGIKHLGKYRRIYLVEEDGKIKRVVLPVVGKGLWSTMYGFLALDGDMRTVESMSFYQHGETPGLGGEVDNPRWKQSWVGKLAYDESWQPQIDVVKGRADPNAPSEVDGLSGATLTARGVQNLVRFWLSDEGYARILKKKLAQGA